MSKIKPSARFEANSSYFSQYSVPDGETRPDSNDDLNENIEDNIIDNQDGLNNSWLRDNITSQQSENGAVSHSPQQFNHTLQLFTMSLVLFHFRNPFIIFGGIF